MVDRNYNLLCEEAKLYYYDCLCNESHGLIPEFINDHIEQCQHCQEQIDQLTVVLSQTDGTESGQRQVSSAITTMLELHFAYIGKRVTCNTVRPFLPGLLDPALETRIPTPITAHLDNCRQCAEDLEAIKRLSLNRIYLYRLSQLFAEKPSRDPTKCSEMGTIVKSVAAMDLDGTTAEALKHLCKCPACRNRLYLERQKIYDSLPEDTQFPEFSCESVSETDIFDYCLPYGLDPANEQSAESRESLASHLRSCPACLDKIQQLHNTLYGMAERVESEVVTIYNINESDKAQGPSESDDLYAGFPISVEIAGRQDKADAEKPVPTIDFTTVLNLKRKIRAMNLRPFIKTGIAAAVILAPVALFFLFFSTPSAKALTPEQIYKALEIVKNVHIVKSVPGKTEPTTEIIEQMWFSQTENKYMTKTEKGFVLGDITNKVITARQLGTDSSVETQMPEVVAAEMSRRIKSSFGLMPSYNIEFLPGYEWHRVDDQIPEVADGIEIYDLTWTRETYSSSVFHKWRYFVDPKTNLPKRIETYKKSAADSEYEPKSVIEIQDLSDSEIQAVIKKAGLE